MGRSKRDWIFPTTMDKDEADLEAYVNTFLEIPSLQFQSQGIVSVAFVNQFTQLLIFDICLI